MTNNKLYPEVKTNVDFPELERKILDYWDQNNIFEQSVNQRPEVKNDKNNEFIFYDGPPFANGLPHYGHLLTGFVKDAFARYQTIKGKKVERRFGWDCHGLPAEMGAEKELGFSGRIAINEYGVDKFNDHCRKSVMKYSQDWEKYVKRQARWVDFDNSYKTMDKDFMESVLWAFKELYNKGLIYESMKVMPYSWVCQTPLSNFETRLDNSYREKVDKAVTASFILKEKPEGAPDNCSSYKILAWTTTPWTLPSNLALAVGNEMEYSCVVKDNVCYLIASFALESYKKELGIEEHTSFTKVKGSKLVGLKYEPLFDYFADYNNAFQVVAGDFVVEGDGTGIVHIAPGFGEDDQILCQEVGIEIVCPVDNAGKFTDEVKDFAGMQVFDANDKIIIKLKEQGSWIKTEQYIHNYPHCWRTDTPLIYKAVPSWYVKVTEFKDRMVELNQQINWIPGNVKDGLFGKWLENARDWSISRNRFWGTPIPVWRSDNPKYPRIDVYGSCAEMEKDFGVKIDDLHKPFIDSLTRPNPDDPTGKSIMRRVEDVFDCWFESGSMPYGQVHYPFENKEWFENHFPADFIVEYSAQTRGWFYTLMVLSTALFDRPPFLNCICHGVILDSTGQKLSKRLNNYADPMELFEKYGADALRITMLSSNVVKGQELLIDKDGKMVFDVLRLFIKPIWSSYHFFCLYANIDDIKAKKISKAKNVLDRYILSKLKIAVEQIEQGMNDFDTQIAYNISSNFFEILNNWYIRRSRNRFWQTEQNQDKIDAYDTLYTCIETMSRVLSPLLPMITENIYLGLNNNIPDKKSVHLDDFPKVDQIEFDEELVSVMDQVLDICSTALFIRSSTNIRVRQPLSTLTIIADNANKFKDFAELIKDEINVKSIIYNNELEKHATTKLSINFPVLGKRLPHKMKEIIKLSKQGNWEYDGSNLKIGDEILKTEEYSLILEPQNMDGAKSFASNKGIIALDLNITKELKEEGIARDLVRFIQQARKDAGFDVADRIKLSIQSELELSHIIETYQEFIGSQTLSEFDNDLIPEFTSKVKIEDKELIIAIKRV